MQSLAHTAKLLYWGKQQAVECKTLVQIIWICCLENIFKLDFCHASGFVRMKSTYLWPRFTDPLPACNLLPWLWKFTARHVWTLTTVTLLVLCSALYWSSHCGSSEQRSILKCMCLVYLNIFVFILLHICIFVHFVVFVKAAEWQRHQGGRRGGKKGATFLLPTDLELPTALQVLPYKDNHGDEEDFYDGDGNIIYVGEI